MFKPFSTEYSLTLPNLNLLDLGGDDPFLPSHSFKYPNLFSLYSMNPSIIRRNFVYSVIKMKDQGREHVI